MCVSVFLHGHMCAWCLQRQEGISDSLELELKTVISYV